MDFFVIKVILEDEKQSDKDHGLYRFNYASKVGGEDLSFSELEAEIRKTLRLSPTQEIRVNYEDDQGEFPRMHTDETLKDALLIQGLKPLRLKVKLVVASGSSIAVAETPKDDPGDEDKGGLWVTKAAPIKPKCYDCEMCPIVGPWYQATTMRLLKYEVCEQCWATSDWRKTRSLKFKLINKCEKCQQHKPDVARYPYEGDVTTLLSDKSLRPTGEEMPANDGILLCQGCFKQITRSAIEMENRVISQSRLETTSEGRNGTKGSKLPHTTTV